MHFFDKPMQNKAALSLVTLGLFSFAAAQPARAGGTIDTTPQWNGTSSISPFGEPDTSVYGQTITATASLDSLNSFTFYLTSTGGGSSLAYSANVYAWDGSKATGPALFTQVSNTGPLGTSFTAITTHTGAVALTPGQQYVLFFSTDGLQNGSSNLSAWGLTGGGYSGGSFVFQNNGGDGSQITSQPWTNVNPYDLAFLAHFGSPIPEASSSVSLGLLLALSLVGLAAARKRKVAASAE